MTTIISSIGTLPFSLIVIFFVDLSLYFHSILIMPMLHDENEDKIPGKEVSVLIKPAKGQQKIKALPDVIPSHMEEDKDLIIISEEINPHQRSSMYGKPFRVAICERETTRQFLDCAEQVDNRSSSCVWNKYGSSWLLLKVEVSLSCCHCKPFQFP